MAINELTKNFLRTIKSTKSSIIDLFNIIKQSWKIKKKLSKLITNKRIENMFRNLTKIGVYPGKILGAGNGGFILCFVDSSKKKSMSKLLKKYKYYDFKIEQQGSKII